MTVPQTALMSSTRISEQTATISVYRINRLVVILFTVWYDPNFYQIVFIFKGSNYKHKGQKLINDAQKTIWRT